MPASVDPVSPAPQPEWRERRRSRILAAAEQLFAQHAYPVVQMDEIARAAGMGKATLYRYFASKEALYLEIFDQALIALTRRISAHLDAGRPPAETMAAIIAAMVGTFMVHIGTLRTLMADENQLADRMRRIFRSRRREIHGLLTRAIEQGTDNGEFRQLDGQIAPSVLIGMCWGGIMGTSAVEASTLARTVTDIFLHGASGSASERDGRTARDKRRSANGVDTAVRALRTATR